MACMEALAGSPKEESWRMHGESKGGKLGEARLPFPKGAAASRDGETLWCVLFDGSLWRCTVSTGLTESVAPVNTFSWPEGMALCEDEASGKSTLFVAEPMKACIQAFDLASCEKRLFRPMPGAQHLSVSEGKDYLWVGTVPGVASGEYGSQVWRCRIASDSHSELVCSGPGSSFSGLCHFPAGCYSSIYPLECLSFAPDPSATGAAGAAMPPPIGGVEAGDADGPTATLRKPTALLRTGETSMLFVDATATSGLRVRRADWSSGSAEVETLWSTEKGKRHESVQGFSFAPNGNQAGSMALMRVSSGVALVHQGSNSILLLRGL